MMHVKIIGNNVVIEGFGRNLGQQPSIASLGRNHGTMVRTPFAIEIPSADSDR